MIKMECYQRCLMEMSERERWRRKEDGQQEKVLYSRECRASVETEIFSVAYSANFTCSEPRLFHHFGRIGEICFPKVFHSSPYSVDFGGLHSIIKVTLNYPSVHRNAFRLRAFTFYPTESKSILHFIRYGAFFGTDLKIKSVIRTPFVLEF